jgi:hypothetical protein
MKAKIFENSVPFVAKFYTKSFTNRKQGCI